MTSILLVNMPFAALDSPSLALGLFKTRLRQQGFHCDVQHLNFAFAEIIGYENYEFMLRLQAILGGEQLFARSLFGDSLPPESEYYREVTESKSAGPGVLEQMDYIRMQVPAFLDYCVNAIRWQDYEIIGFTSLFEQNLSSLSLARLIKARFPQKTIVFGGANCEDIMGLTLHQRFPFVDFVVAGEGDKSFPELVKRLHYHHSIQGLRGVVHREIGHSTWAGEASVIEDLDDLPIPDYDDYFERLQMSPLRSRIIPSLLMESARGCWWGEKSHCTFCGLNGLTMRFRTKTVPRTIAEIETLTQRYGAGIVRFVDNILSPNYFRDLLPEIARRGPKANYICEVKSNLKKYQIKALADAGVTVQAGIENLSTHVLDLMAKGSNALMNVQTLKWCKQLGVMADWNLIYGFPGEEPQDYQDNLQLAELITHLNPPSGCGPIRLDRFSPNFNRAEEKGIVNIRPLKFYKYIYPFDAATLSKLVYYFDFDYRQPIDNGGCLNRLEQMVQRWKQQPDMMSAERVNGHVTIRDTRPVAGWRELNITGLAARIYEYCDKAQSLRRIVEAANEFGEGDVTDTQVLEILNEFVRAKLMACEGNRYLSLAVLTYSPSFRQGEDDDPERLKLTPADQVVPPQLIQLQRASR